MHATFGKLIAVFFFVATSFCVYLVLKGFVVKLPGPDQSGKAVQWLGIAAVLGIALIAGWIARAVLPNEEAAWRNAVLVVLFAECVAAALLVIYGMFKVGG